MRTESEMRDTSTARSADAIALKARLRSELRWLRIRLIGHALLMLVGGVGMLGVATVLTSAAWRAFGPTGAWVILGVSAFGIAWLAYFEVLGPLRRIANLKGFSRELESHGRYSNLLEAATQFTSPRKLDPLRWGASSDLVAEILRRARSEAEATTLSPRVPLVGLMPHVLLAAAAMLGWLALGVFAPQQVRESFEALRHPTRLMQHEALGGLYLLSNDLQVPVGDDVVLGVRDFSAGGDEVLLLVNQSGDFWQEFATSPVDATLDPAPYRDVEGQLNAIEDPFRYRFRKGAILTDIAQVTVRERPVLRQMSALLTPPEYSGRAAEERSEIGGTVAVLVGTRVELKGRATAELQAATRIVDDAEPLELAVEGDRFTDSFVVSEDLSFRVGLVDSEGLRGEARTVYHFVARADEPPTIELIKPGQDLTLERDLLVTIGAIAADDVGLDRIELLARTEEEAEWKRIVLYSGDGQKAADDAIGKLILDSGDNEIALGFEWSLGDESLFPGETLSYCLEATDNNALEGGQTTRSAVYRLRLPTIAEVFAEEKAERSEDQGELADILDEGKELRETLERLNRELKKNPTPDFAKQEEIKDALERQDALREKLQEAANELQKDLQNFEQDNSGSMELLQKMETIQDLLDSIEDENLQAYLEAMQDAMDQLLPHEVQRAMEDALANQEEYNRKLDRTIELLQQLERERTMSDLVEEVAEALERQEDLLASNDEGEDGESSDGEEGEQSDGELSEGESSEGEPSEGEQSDGDESSEGEKSEGENQESAGEQMSDEEKARAQEKLAEETARLEERLREALEELKAKQEKGEASDPSAGKMSESLEDAEQEMQEGGSPSESMSDAQQELQQGDKEEAQSKQEESVRRLLRLYETLAEGQQSMQQATQKYASEQLQQTAFDLLSLSFSEEQLVDILRDGVRGQRMAPITREQGRIHRSTERLSENLQELARENFFIPEPLLASMRELVESLEQSVEEMQLTRTRRSRDAGRESMGQMNKIVMSLLTAATNAGQGGGGGESQSLSQQMQQMSEDQARLNAMTRDLKQKMEQGLSAQEQRQLAELQGRQQALREQLDKVREQIEDERRVLSDLDALAEEMDEVVDGLESGQLSQPLERQQEKILSRMLDAQRSIRERDFAKRRESREGQELFSEQDGSELLAGELEWQSQLRRWLAPERAPSAYEDDVRRYFRRIQGELESGGGE